MELSQQHLITLPSNLNKQERFTQAETFFKSYDYDTPGAGDLFFETFGIGNDKNIAKNPFERLSDYEELLQLIQRTNPTKYLVIHKGTPFYFMGWLAFQTKSFEKGMFYMDAAVSEDIRRTIESFRRTNHQDTRTDEQLHKTLMSEWSANESVKFFTLTTTLHRSIQEVNDRLKSKIEFYISLYNSITGSSLTFQKFIDKFILKLAETGNTRSIITALYSFILELEEIQKILLLRGSGSGSLEPITTYLLKGGLLFESILKQKYPLKADLTITKTIGDIATLQQFKTKYSIPNISSSSTDLASIASSMGTGRSCKEVFDITAKIRNTTGHNLAWDDIFNNQTVFNDLVEHIILSILYIVDLDFI
jgi:hypothetical protein